MRSKRHAGVENGVWCACARASGGGTVVWVQRLGLCAVQNINRFGNSLASQHAQHRQKTSSGGRRVLARVCRVCAREEEREGRESKAARAAYFFTMVKRAQAHGFWEV